MKGAKNTRFKANLIRRFSMPAPSWLAGIFLLSSFLLIFLGDKLADSIVGENMHMHEKIHFAEAGIFLLITGFFLYIYSRKIIDTIRSSDLRTEKLRTKYEALNSTAREGLFDYNFLERTATVNAQMKFFFPSEKNEIPDFFTHFQHQVHPDDMERITREYKEIDKNKSASWKSEFRLKGVDGQYYRLISNAHIIRNPVTGMNERLVGALLDISDLRNLQTEYYEQKLHHRRTLAASIIMAQENERTRWAQELHDNVCQILSVANMYAIDIAEHPENVTTLGEQLKKLVAESISEIRQLSATIRTPAFDQETLQEAILKLSANINRLNPLKIILDDEKFYEESLDNDRKLMIYRVVQEQVNNIIKYAEAQSVQISLDNTSSDLVLIKVTDDGKGFVPEQALSGIGLKNIQGRLQVYNGNLKIQSSPGNGCILEASFPW